MNTSQIEICAGNYDGIELHGINDDGEPIASGQPVQYSVQLHCIEGGAEAIKDFDSYAEAKLFADAIAQRYVWEIMDFTRSLSDRMASPGARMA